MHTWIQLLSSIAKPKHPSKTIQDIQIISLSFYEEYVHQSSLSCSLSFHAEIFRNVAKSCGRRVVHTSHHTSHCNSHQGTLHSLLMIGTKQNEAEQTGMEWKLPRPSATTFASIKPHGATTAEHIPSSQRARPGKPTLGPRSRNRRLRHSPDRQPTNTHGFHPP